MGIFGNKKEEVKKADAPVENKTEKKADAKVSVSETGIVPGNILVKPHITEKALLAGSNDVYVFEIYPRATKGDVAKAVKEAYNVEVVAVNIAKTPTKKSSRRMKGRRGTKGGAKKAYVTLKKGTRLQLV